MLSRRLTTLAVGVFWLISIIVLYGVFVRFLSIRRESIEYYLSAGVGLLVFVGFAGLYGMHKFEVFGGVAFPIVAAGLAMLFYVLLNDFWNKVFNGTFQNGRDAGIGTSVNTDAFHCALAILVTLGAMMGKVGLRETLTIAALTTVGYTLNKSICREVMSCTDEGGAFLIHLFGGSAGLGLSFLFKPRDAANHPFQRSGYMASTIVVGSAFVWVMLPSFNSARLTLINRDVAFLNTALSICVSTIAGFAVERLLVGRAKLRNVLRAAFSGGVIVAASSYVTLNPAASMFAGFLSGAVTVPAFHWLGALLAHAEIHDSLDTLGLHFLPGLLGGACSAIMYSFLGRITLPAGFTDYLGAASSTRAAGLQFACTMVSLGIGLATGLVAGLLLRLLCLGSYEEYVESGCYAEKDRRLPKQVLFNDFAEWDIELVDDLDDPDDRVLEAYQDQPSLNALQEEKEIPAQ